MRKQLIIDLAEKSDGGYSVANTIDLITQYRAIHGCSLLQAKKDIDALKAEIEFYSKEATPNVMTLSSILIRKIEEIREQEDAVETLKAIDRFMLDLAYKKKKESYDFNFYGNAPKTYPENK